MLINGRIRVLATDVRINTRRPLFPLPKSSVWRGKNSKSYSYLDIKSAFVVKEIETLIPHRNPFLYVDKLCSLSREEIIGTTIFPESNEFLAGSFPQFNYVPGVILIEAMAQCGGAGIKKLGLADGLFGFANIEAANFYRGVQYGDLFKMVIRNIKVTDKYFKQSGTGFASDIPCMDLTWTCVKFQ